METVYHRLALKRYTKVIQTNTTNLLQVNQQRQYERKEDESNNKLVHKQVNKIHK